MKNRILSISILAILLSFTSCIKHEVIPPPTSTVDLNCNFVGYVNGTQTELTQNVLGYNAIATNDKYVYSGIVLSRMIYNSQIKSIYQPQSFKLNLVSNQKV